MRDVVEETDADAALGRGEQRREDEGSGVGLEADVVERDVERRPRIAEERRDASCDVGGSLPTVAQCLEGDRGRRGAGHPAAAARS